MKTRYPDLAPSQLLFSLFLPDKLCLRTDVTYMTKYIATYNIGEFPSDTFEVSLSKVNFVIFLKYSFILCSGYTHLEEKLN